VTGSRSGIEGVSVRGSSSVVARGNLRNASCRCGIAFNDEGARMSTHDVVVIGSGHNGLIAATYLAKAGLDVCVVEKNDRIGGGTVTVEGPVKGYRHDLASTAHQFLQFNPMIMDDELGLKSKYGLEYIIADGPQMAILFEDGRSLVVYKDIAATCEQIAQFSEKDASAYEAWYVESSKAFEMLKAGATSPSPGFGEFVSFLDDTVEGQQTLGTLHL
jgi:phytoene dehydrogenase-like protein